MAVRKKKAGYHHGDLRVALLDAALGGPALDDGEVVMTLSEVVEPCAPGTCRWA
mgnify:CR=1 FL=1